MGTIRLLGGGEWNVYTADEGQVLTDGLGLLDVNAIVGAAVDFTATPVPTVSSALGDAGGGSGATVASITVDANGDITGVTWASGGFGYEAGDRIRFRQGDTVHTYTLLAADVNAAGALQDLSSKTLAGTAITFDEFAQGSVADDGIALNWTQNWSDEFVLAHLHAIGSFLMQDGVSLSFMVKDWTPSTLAELMGTTSQVQAAGAGQVGYTRVPLIADRSRDPKAVLIEGLSPYQNRYKAWLYLPKAQIKRSGASQLARPASTLPVEVMALDIAQMYIQTAAAT